MPAQAVPEVFAERLAIRQPGEHAAVLTMSASFNGNPVMAGLVESGTETDVFAVDSIGHAHGEAFALLAGGGAEHKGKRDEFINDFQGSYLLLDPPGSRIPILDSSHIKAYKVGDWALAFGGVNSALPAYEFVDLMLELESEDFALFLDRFIEHKGNLRASGEAGERFRISDESEVLVDYGKRGESIVMDSLLDDLDQEVSSVRASSSYVPQGRLDENLSLHAADSSEVIFYTNRPNKFHSPVHSPLERIFNQFNSFRARTKWSDNTEKFNHLKAVIITLTDGSKITYVLTNTMSEPPVKAGTAEIALRTTDSDLAEEIEAFMIDNLGPD